MQKKEGEQLRASAGNRRLNVTSLQFNCLQLVYNVGVIWPCFVWIRIQAIPTGCGQDDYCGITCKNLLKERNSTLYKSQHKNITIWMHGTILVKMQRDDSVWIEEERERNVSDCQKLEDCKQKERKSVEPKILFPANSKFCLMKISMRWKDSPLGEWNHVGIFLIFGLLKGVYKADLL